MRAVLASAAEPLGYEARVAREVRWREATAGPPRGAGEERRQRTAAGDDTLVHRGLGRAERVVHPVLGLADLAGPRRFSARRVPGAWRSFAN